MSQSRKVFVNLAVNNLPQSMAFFTSLGFTFNKQFTDDKAACMVLSEEGYVMLLKEPFFRSFTPNRPCDTSTHAEALIALSCTSREEVDGLVEKALAAGGRSVMPTQDHGFMYGRSFQDVDGHQWELIWMDPAVVQK